MTLQRIKIESYRGLHALQKDYALTSKAQRAALTSHLPDYFQSSVLEDDGAVDVIAIEADINASIIAIAVSFDNHTIAILRMANTGANMIRILISYLAIFIVNNVRAARCSWFRRGNFYRIAVDNMLVVLLNRS